MIAVSVVIPIYNQAHLVGRTIEAIRANSLQPIEVIIVDDGSSDDVRSIILAYESLTAFPLRLLEVNHGGPGRARDAGWREAIGEIVAFTDADAVPDRHWLENGVQAFSSPDVGAVEGAVESGGGKPTIFTHQVRNRFGRQFMTANMFYRRSVIAEVGGFKSPYREDSDLAFSVLDAGYEIVFVPTSVVIHPPRQENWRFYFAKANRKRFEGLLFRNHPETAPQYIPRFQPTELLIITGELLALLSVVWGSWSLAAGLLLLALGMPKRLADWLGDREYNSREYLWAWLMTLILVPVEAYYHWTGIIKPPAVHKDLRR
ncbi:MAG: hypothetical protein C7B44_00460 [Sulfobacillus thermosulfidooxidans]|nr:MAG: hypothetical protein C7B44_00460 [Sulfobacillus thermosulfidooxidans]